ncbi:MAG: hypothetical protein ACWGMZ_03985 [Thermoguttaceae bacterium]
MTNPNIFCRVKTTETMMVVVDENGHTHEACLLSTAQEARIQLRLWQGHYIFDFVKALNEVSRYFDAKDTNK